MRLIRKAIIYDTMKTAMTSITDAHNTVTYEYNALNKRLRKPMHGQLNVVHIQQKHLLEP